MLGKAATPSRAQRGCQRHLSRAFFFNILVNHCDDFMGFFSLSF